MEVVGAVASISQLAQYTAKLIICLKDISKNVHRSSDQFRNYQHRANELQKIVSLIKGNQELHAQLLDEPIAALLATIQAILKDLKKKFVDDSSNLSKKWKNWAKAARILQAESEISGKFDELERHKSTLALAILENLGGYMHRIDTRLPEIHEQILNIERTLVACANIPDDGRRKTNLFARPTITHPQSDYGLDTGKECDGVGFNGTYLTPELLFSSAYSTFPTTLASSRSSISDSEIRDHSRNTERQHKKSAGSRVYTNNTALEQALQINGNVGVDGLSGQGSVQTYWTNNSAAGQSRQVNGDIFDPDFASRLFS